MASLAQSDQLAGNSHLQSVMYFPAKHTQAQHLGRCQFGAEFRIKVSSDGLDALVAIVLLHAIITATVFSFKSAMLKNTISAGCS